MKRRIWLLSRSLAISSLVLLSLVAPASTQSSPYRTEIRPISELREITRDMDVNVQRTDGDTTWRPAITADYLLSGNWLATGQNAWTRIWYNVIDVIYTQSQNTFSQFSPDRSCGFRVISGSSLLASDNSECELISERIEAVLSSVPDLGSANKELNSASTNKDQETEANSSAVALFLFRNRDDRETIVGVLASPLGSVTIKAREDSPEPITTFANIGNDENSNQIELREGEFAYIFDNGRFVRGAFSIRDFLRDNPLALGLSDSPEDDEYVENLESEDEQELMTEIRLAIGAAVENQPEPGSFEVVPLGQPSFNIPLPPSFPGTEDGNTPCQSCPNPSPSPFVTPNPSPSPFVTPNPSPAPAPVK